MVLIWHSIDHRFCGIGNQTQSDQCNRWQFTRTRTLSYTENPFGKNHGASDQESTIKNIQLHIIHFLKICPIIKSIKMRRDLRTLPVSQSPVDINVMNTCRSPPWRPCIPNLDSRSQWLRNFEMLARLLLFFSICSFFLLGTSYIQWLPIPICFNFKCKFGF